MTVFAIVVSYNGVQWIERCLRSLQGSNQKVFPIIIDNASTDETIELIRSKFPEIEIIELRKNIGFGQANNIGIVKSLDSGADYVFLLNQDAYVEPDSIGDLIKIHSCNPDFGILSPIHLNGTGTELDLGFSTYVNSWCCPKFISDLYLGKLKNEPYKIEFVNAASWLMSKKCLQKVGGFSPAFFHYGEDDNYIHRCHFHGIKTGVYARARVMHDRENRIKYPIDILGEQRQKIISYLNPNQKCSIDKDISTLRNKYFKLILKLKLGYARVVRREIKFWKSKAELISFCHAKSKEVGYTFLSNEDKRLN